MRVRVTPDTLDRFIKVSFATMVLGVTYAELAPQSGGVPGLLLWLGGMAGVAVAGFWRARLVRKAQLTPVADGGAAAPVGLPPVGRARRSELLRDVGIIAFALGLFLLLTWFVVAVGPGPNPDLAITGVVLTAGGALALAKRYRFFAVLAAFFLAPIAIIVAFVVWPPSFFVFLAILFAWAIARLWRRAHPHPSA